VQVRFQLGLLLSARVTAVEHREEVRACAVLEAAGRSGAIAAPRCLSRVQVQGHHSKPREFLMRTPACLKRVAAMVASTLLACSRMDAAPRDGSAAIGTETRQTSVTGHDLPEAAIATQSGAALQPRTARWALTTPYPIAHWRLARAEQLSHAAVWPSHILIRHRDVPAGLIAFEPPEWTSAPPAPSRTREAAFELARTLAERVAADPDGFETLARESSEDGATREEGGSLGTYDAFRLIAWPQVLDALAAIEPGQTSRVVETQFGFHVFKRRPPPPDVRVSGARIIIGHDDAPWLERHLARSVVPRRSRAEALALANSIYSRARANPGAFSGLVAEFSEHRDALRGGDFGEWSAQEPSSFRQAIGILGRLEIGEVAPPVDSFFGYQIIQRTKNRARAVYSMKAVRVFYDSLAHDAEPSSRANALHTASRIVETVVAEPSRFGEFQEQLCCVATQTWVEGRENPRIERALAGLRPGEIARDAIEDGRSFWIVQRLEAQEPLPLALSFELPAPERADVEYVVAHAMWMTEFERAWRSAERMLQLKEPDAQRFRALHAIEPRMKAARSEDERVEIYRELQGQLRELLGPSTYERYSDAIEGSFREVLLGSPGSEGARGELSPARRMP
jgi:hypothetical protein